MDNPLLNTSTLPAFSCIKASHIEPALDRILKDNREALAKLLAKNSHYTWENLVRPLEDGADQLSRAWSPVNHLHSVADNDELREAYNACLPKLTEYGTEMGQHEGLYQAYLQIRKSDEFISLDPAQQKSIENEIRDFHLSGIGLDEEDRDKYKSVKQQLSQLQTKFEENLLDATQSWSRLIDDQAQLSGLPASALALAAQNAQRKSSNGWLITLDFPS
jgi:oligopeptidase A